MPRHLALLLTGVVLTSSAQAASPDWVAACSALFKAAKGELTKVNPIFAKSTVKLDGGDLTWRLKRGEAEEWEMGARRQWGRWIKPWYDPGCGDGCPTLIAQRESIAREAHYYIQTTALDEAAQQGFATIARKTLDDCLALAVGPNEGFSAGFWRPLVVAGARWTLVGVLGGGTITVETYDARKVGAADVARLRWTLVDKAGKKSDIGNSDAGRYTQLAVSAGGLYLLDADQNDASVTTSLAKKPARSDPPKPYAGTSANQGRFLELVQTSSNAALACMGVGPTGDSAEAKVGMLCVSPTAGVVELDGRWSPTGEVFENKSVPR